MSKTVEVDSCAECPWFATDDYVCEKLEKHNGTTIIPEWCPLPDTQEQLGWRDTESAPKDKHAILTLAASDLYDALKNLLSRVANDADSCTWFCDEQEAAIRAMAKARGEINHD